MRLTPSALAAAPCLVLLASCVGPAPERRPTPAPAPAPVERPTPAPPPAAPTPAAPAPTAADWQYRPAAPGSWTYRSDAAGSVAQFGTQASIRCDIATRRIRIARAGGTQGPLTIRTSFGAVGWPATASGGAMPELVAVRAANDVVLDQIAYSRGRFALEAAGLPMLILPPWAEVARVIEDCRA